MRLTDEVLTASDNSHLELVYKAIVLAAAGRFGLFPSVRPFQVSISINKNIVDVESLDCLAITKGGDLIDAKYDTNYTNSYDTRIVIPDTDDKSLYLIISTKENEWRDTNDGYCQPVYSFGVISENTALPDNSFPIARIVDDYGWRMDDIDFIPPCLYISSHQYYKNEYEQFNKTLHYIESSLINSIDSDCKVAIGIYWPAIQQLVISLDKDRDFMTPMMLLGCIQRCVGAFICACMLEEHLNLGESEQFQEFVRSGYNYKNVHQKIREGIELCSTICSKVDRFKEIENVKPEPQQAKPEPATQPKKRPGWMGIEI